jgi:hypothetical protein
VNFFAEVFTEAAEQVFARLKRKLSANGLPDTQEQRLLGLSCLVASVTGRWIGNALLMRSDGFSSPL